MSTETSLKSVTASPLPAGLTSYDLLKSLALILMIVDHIGYYFFPEMDWLRIMGRLCLPIWFFLIGFANTDEVPRRWWLCAALVFISSPVFGHYILPVNILFTLIMYRLMRPYLVRSLQSAEALRGVFFLIVLTYLPTSLVFEYGTAGLLLVVMGYYVRRKQGFLELIPLSTLRLYGVAAMATLYFILGIALPSISVVQALLMFIGFVIVGYMLWSFKPVVYQDASRFMAGSFIKAFQFLGRNTLELYVFHVILFRILALYFSPEDFELLDIKWIPTEALSAFF